MSAFDPFNRVVTNMMRQFGTSASILVAGAGTYDPSTSEYTETDTEYIVKAMFFDFNKQNNGLREATDTLIQEGDKQVLIQPLDKTDPALSLPSLQPNKDRIKIAGKIYKIVTVKQVNTTMNDCILYEIYCRE